MFERLFWRTKEAAIEIKVTERGFEPARIRVPRGEATTLSITRTTERTCARELVLDELGIDEELPFGKAVQITLEPKESGPLKFGCAMGKMIGGVVDVV